MPMDIERRDVKPGGQMLSCAERFAIRLDSQLKGCPSDLLLSFRLLGGFDRILLLWEALTCEAQYCAGAG
jgi:hypothetical protein